MKTVSAKTARRAGSWLAITISVVTPVLAQTTTGATVTALSRTTVRLEWTSTVTVSQQVHYGSTPAYGKVLKDYVGTVGNKYTAVLTGLAPGSTTYFCPTPVDTPPLPECLANRNTFSVKTIAGPPRYPDIAQPVLSTTTQVNGTTFTVREDCSDLQQQLDAAANANPSLTHEVRIPLPAVCTGRYTLRDRPTDSLGWVLVRTDVPDDKLPPPNSQTDATYAGTMATIKTNYVSAYDSSIAPGACYLGEFWLQLSAPDWSLYRCTATSAPNMWTRIPAAASGRTVPSTCSVGDWFVKTDTSDRRQAAWWCTTLNRYEQVYFGYGGAFFDYAAITASPNATKYQLIGLQITHLQLPASYAAQFSGPGSRKKGNTCGCLVYTPTTSNQIVFDRVWFRGQGYPSNLWYGFCLWDGRNHVIKNSYFSEINRAVHSTDAEDDARAINVERGPGPALIENNTFEEVLGITIFISDDKGSSVGSPSDYTIRGNRFKLSDAYNRLSSASNGRYYYRRHHLELKRGIRFTVENNIFDGGWTSVNQGATLMLTPRLGDPSTTANTIGITDFLFRHNFVTNTPQFAVISGHNDGYSVQPLTSQRIQFYNNLFTGLSGYRTGWGGAAPATGQVMNIGLGLEDFFIENNTVLDAEGNCCTPNFVSHAWPIVNSGLSIKNNIYSVKNASPGGIWYGGTAEGKSVLDSLWREGSGTSYSVVNNWFVRPGQLPTNYPIGITWGSSTAEAGVTPDGGNVNSPPTRGVDLQELKKRTRTLENLRFERVSVNSVSALFKISTLESRPVCTLDVATDSAFSTTTRYTDSTSGPDKAITASGLAPGMRYYFRVSCENRPQTGYFDN